MKIKIEPTSNGSGTDALSVAVRQFLVIKKENSLCLRFPVDSCHLLFFDFLVYLAPALLLFSVLTGWSPVAVDPAEESELLVGDVSRGRVCSAYFVKSGLDIRGRGRPDRTAGSI